MTRPHDDAQHTPGPWTIALIDRASIRATFGNRRSHEIVRVFSGEEHGQQEANARLIAAAPALLAELRNLRRRFHSCCMAAGNTADVADAACAAVDAAIAKAEGRT